MSERVRITILCEPARVVEAAEAVRAFVADGAASAIASRRGSSAVFLLRRTPAGISVHQERERIVEAEVVP